MVDKTLPTDEHDEPLNQVLVEYFDARDSGRIPTRDELLARHPELTGHPDVAEQIDEFLDDQQLFDRFSEALDVSGISAEQDTASHQNQATPDPSRSTAVSRSRRAATLEPGMQFGDYELVEEIARGGMGVVYKARQVKLDRVVAIKMILTGQFASEEDVRRFQTEAQAAANLRHANIVAIHDVGEHEEQAYFSMQYIEGQSLAELVRDEAIEPRRAAQYLATIADAVHYAHEKSTLHRDLKPSNILIDSDDQPHITDFGLAKRIQADPQLTTSGAILGTPSYMSPEQAMGKSERIDRTTDVYSLGATLYHLLTGRPPLQGDSPLDTIRQVANDRPASPRQINEQIPRDLENICLKCLEKESSARYATARELADDLRRFLRGEPVHARPIRLIARAVRWSRKHPWRVIVTLLMLGGLAWGVDGYMQAAHLAHLDRLEIPYVVEPKEGQLTTTLGDKVTIIYEGVADVHLMSKATGHFTGRGGQQHTVVMNGGDVRCEGTNGPLGISRLTVNGHTLRLYDHGRKVLVDAPGGGGKTYFLASYRHLTIVIESGGSHRVLREGPPGRTPTSNGEQLDVANPQAP
jgi:tRNA A-37 threonylcarbamoyl transferase component Bud32